MQKILHILKKFRIKGRGDVYTLKNLVPGTEIHIGEQFFDLRNHRFSIKGIGMRRLGETAGNEYEIDAVFEELDGEEITGTLLLSSFQINWLYCNHPLYANKPDEDYAEEYAIGKEKFPCALFSYEDMQIGKLSLYGTEISGATVYRGWMMKPDLYERMYTALLQRGIILINSPNEYKKYHMLPEWYEDFKGDTPKSVWTEGTDIELAMERLKELKGSAIVKDYVKSRKHEWYEACYIPQVTDFKNAREIIWNFVRRQGDSLTGGIVLREFLELRKIGYHEKSGMPLSEEYRVFICAGRVFMMDDYWEHEKKGVLSQEDMAFIQKICRRIQSNFVTVDFARCQNGELKVIELGDGQVSGLQQMNLREFYQKIFV